MATHHQAGLNQPTREKRRMLVLLSVVHVASQGQCSRNILSTLFQCTVLTPSGRCYAVWLMRLQRNNGSFATSVISTTAGSVVLPDFGCFLAPAYRTMPGPND